MEIEILSILFGVYIFALCLFLSKMLFHGGKNLESRLDLIARMGKRGDREERQEKKKKNQGRLQKFNLSGAFLAELEGAGVKISGQEYLMIWASAVILPTSFSYFMTGKLMTSIAVLAVCAMLPPMVIKSLRKKRLDKFSVQLGDALMTVSNCLRSGFSFRQAIERIAMDMPDPIGEEFKAALLELNYGASMDSALGGVAKRMENRDMEMINSAIMVQQKVGGNLSEVIDNVSVTIKDRIQIRQSLKTLTAQGRISGTILGLIPVFTLMALSVINPEYMSAFYTTDFGRILFLLSAVMELIGFLVIRKIVNIRI